MQTKFDHFNDKKVWRKAVAHLKKNDRTLAKTIDDIKIPNFKLHDDYYESIINSIISQQISWAAANAILKKFEALYGGKLPRPREFLATNQRKIRNAGVSPQKYSYIKDLCEKIEDGRVELKKFNSMADEDIIRELDDVKGIGRWTAEMFLMFSLGRTDVWPVDDLGIRKAVQRVYKMKKLPEPKSMLKMGEKWRPYRTVASLYLWHSNDNKK